MAQIAECSLGQPKNITFSTEEEAVATAQQLFHTSQGRATTLQAALTMGDFIQSYMDWKNCQVIATAVDDLKLKDDARRMHQFRCILTVSHSRKLAWMASTFISWRGFKVFLPLLEAELRQSQWQTVFQ